MTDSDKQLLDAYAKEICYPSDLTVQELIAAHRYLRNLNVDNAAHIRKVTEEAEKRAYTQSLEGAIAHEMVSIRVFEKMTVKEVAELITYNRR